MPIEKTPDTFPESPYEEIEVNNFSSTYTIHELATYGQCPLRHYLEYVLKMSPLSGDLTSEETLTFEEQNDILLASEIGEVIALSQILLSNQQIHFNLDGHIISGRLDRLVKTESGIWDGIVLIPENTENLDVFSPEMELYGLLLHSQYPNQQAINIMLFSAYHNRHIEHSFTISDLNELRLGWIGRISNLQHENYTKNLEHCNYCPYSDSEGNCIVNEP